MTSKDISHVIRILKKKTKLTMLASLRKRSAFYILISTILSARNRDDMTIIAARNLLSRYKTPIQLASAPLTDIERLIVKSGFYKTKARRVRDASRVLLERFGGKIPSTMDELLQIPGVGRKTAGCVLVYAFQSPAIPVDTHVHRISNRLGWVRTKTPLATERSLSRKVPLDRWIDVNEVLVIHGQTICHPVSPKCSQCPVRTYCRKIGVRRSR